MLDAIPVPGNSPITKAAVLSAAAGVSTFAISNELYVVNEESVVAFCLPSVWGALIKFGGPMYAEWADAQNKKIKDILNAARTDHTQAVKERIGNVEQMGGVVETTKALFAVSKETAELEAYIARMYAETREFVATRGEGEAPGGA